MLDRCPELTEVMDRISQIVEEYIVQKGFPRPNPRVDTEMFDAWAGLHFGGTSHEIHTHW